VVKVEKQNQGAPIKRLQALPMMPTVRRADMVSTSIPAAAFQTPKSGRPEISEPFNIVHVV